MELSPENAAAALRDIALVDERSREAMAYRKGSSFLFLWGAVWIAGYLGTAVDPARAGPLWLALDGFGILASLALARRLIPPGPQAARWSRRWMASFAVVALFIFASYAILQPRTGLQFATYPAIVLSLLYAQIGLWMLTRYLWIGGAVFILTMIGYFLLAPWICYWIAATGGGALVLSGFWLRRP